MGSTTFAALTTSHSSPSSPVRTTESLEARVRHSVEQDSGYAFRFRFIQFSSRRDVLTVRGSLPSFYLKQVLLSHLQKLEGVNQIEDQVDVVSANGLSSVAHQRVHVSPWVRLNDRVPCKQGVSAASRTCSRIELQMRWHDSERRANIVLLLFFAVAQSFFEHFDQAPAGHHAQHVSTENDEDLWGVHRPLEKRHLYGLYILNGKDDHCQQQNNRDCNAHVSQ